MLSRIVDWLNPCVKHRGAQIVHYLALAIITAIILAGFVVAGYSLATTYNGHYFQTHYQTKHALPRLRPGFKTVQAQRVAVVPAAASITHPAAYPAVGDQGNLGSCAAWASAQALTYEFRQLPATLRSKRWPTFGAKYLYDHYSDTYSSGGDNGSWPDQDLEVVPVSGIPRQKRFPYLVRPFVIDNPLPFYDATGRVSLASSAGQFKVPVTVHTIAIGAGTWSQAAQTVKSKIASNHPVLLAIHVPSDFFNATTTGGLVYGPAGQAIYGGHEIVIIRYDDSKTFPNGDVGGVLVQNQWTANWGAGGRAWLSYRWLQSYSFATQYLTINTTTSVRSGPLPVSADGGRPPAAVKHLAPGASGPRTLGAQPWYVGKPIIDHATGQNLTPLFNEVGDRYNIAPIFLAAVALQESAWNSRAERFAGGIDNSCGLLQQILSNIAAYEGITDPRLACNWEENSRNSVTLGAVMLIDFRAQTGVQVPALWSCYNAGYTCNSPWMSSWWGNWSWTVANYAGSPPAPKPHFHFQHRAWYYYTAHFNGLHPLHKHRSVWAYVGPKGHKALRREARIWQNHHMIRAAGSVIRGPYWHPPNRHRKHGFITMVFRRQTLTWWPHAKGFKPHWQSHREIHF